jgi:hypothetical protein
MITYQLNENGLYAQKIIAGVETGEWANTQTNQAYLKWVAQGNTPLPAENT